MPLNVVEIISKVIKLEKISTDYKKISKNMHKIQKTNFSQDQNCRQIR
jgi:hypothetical protein